ncbi:hypothetical protein [Parasphingorhabdus sp. NYA22]
MVTAPCFSSFSGIRNIVSLIIFAIWLFDRVKFFTVIHVPKKARFPAHVQQRMHGDLTPSFKMKTAKLHKRLAKSSLAGMPLKLHSSREQGWFEHGMAKAINCWLEMWAFNMTAPTRLLPFECE